ncbi:N-acyl-D-aspartate/D-glutamate deacylase [Brachybacterium endophyticum]|uniref:N-acyl-D-aspartate/D-glutamate deacylase n=1 Tax=Brachybacterium endophyticum TaxID=2182385 RepID=A0A2U2RNV0_9MICO|nr:amidohydrolase family protein [Brachybacterium endophyticum]PWH07434.1 N-acyl-D-aspartate/D-glutamate deacylase [Brachybacterium endophyticum]
MTRVLIRGGLVVDGVSPEPVQADVLVEDERIVAVGTEIGEASGSEAAPQLIEADGRLVVPGFVDAHSHAEGVVFDPDVQLALLRQGVTTVIGGQDGVSFAPGDGDFASEYFSPINGAHPSYRGPRVADLLASYDGRIPLGLAYLVPAGTVRHEVMGSAQRPASAEEIERMVALVADGVADGAVGLSTGLDYTPGIFADAEEIAALCAPLATGARGAGPTGTGRSAASPLPYVTHMRGGYEDNARAGVEEAARIGRAAGVPVHISHFHTAADEAHRLMTWLEDQGVEGSFDAYPYTRGCSILAMTMLPPELNALPTDRVVELLGDPGERERLRRDWFPRVATNPSLGPEWPELITLAHTRSDEFAWAPGLTLGQIAARRGTDAVDAALDLLTASRLDVNVIMAVRDQRPVEDLGRLIAHPAHMGGSDGIFIGTHPHPRARGTFAAYLATYVREHGFLNWADAVRHLSTAPVERFHLGARGRIAPGAIADIALIDPDTVQDRATYEAPLQLADGIDDVLVAGRPVLAGGRLTGETPGGGIRASATGLAGIPPA